MRFVSALCIASCALALQIFFVDAVGVSVNVLLGAFVGCAFFLDWRELLGISFLTAYILAPGLFPDAPMAVLLMIPLFILWKRSTFPFERWLASGVCALASVLVLYALFGPWLFFSAYWLVFADALITGAYAALTAVVMEGIV